MNLPSCSQRSVTLLSLLLTSLMWLTMSPLSSLAQTPPDAGTLQQQLEQFPERELPKKIAPEGNIPQPTSQPPTSLTTVYIKDIHFQGNTLFTDHELSTVVKPYTDRLMDLALLNQATATVAGYYRKEGWVVRVSLPKQDITDGLVVMHILEARLGHSTFDGKQPTRVSSTDIKAVVDAPLTPEQLLNTNDVDRGVLLADDLPGVRVTGTLEAGAQKGRTNIRVKAADDDLLRLNLGIDNGGNRGTGRIRGYATAHLESPLQLGDRLSATTIQSEGSEFYRLQYTLPVENDGWRVGGNLSYVDYELITSDFEGLDIKGGSFTGGLEAVYPIIRARSYNLQVLLNYDYRQFINSSLGTNQSAYHIMDGTIGLAGNWFEQWMGIPGANFGSLVWVLGDLDQGSHQAGENPKLEGFFTKLRFHVSRQQQLFPWLALHGAFTGQKSFETLDSAEKFYLGGPTNVRAYPVNEASGSSGWMANLELRGQGPYGLTLTGFYDVGYVRNAARDTPSYHLKGGGMSLAWQSEFGLALDVTWARRLGNNPNPTPTGKDQDGSLKKNRVWLSAIFSF